MKCFVLVLAATFNAEPVMAQEPDAFFDGQPCSQILNAWGMETRAAAACHGAADPVVRGKEALSLGAIGCIGKTGSETADRLAAPGRKLFDDSVAALGFQKACAFFR